MRLDVEASLSSVSSWGQRLQQAGCVPVLSGRGPLPTSLLSPGRLAEQRACPARHPGAVGSEARAPGRAFGSPHLGFLSSLARRPRVQQAPRWLVTPVSGTESFQGLR